MLEMDILTVVLYLATLFSVSHASIFSSDFETKLQAFIGASMKCRHIPGMTLAVVKGKPVVVVHFDKNRGNTIEETP